MTVIKVPKPPKSAMNPDRPASSLLKTQILHMQEAEFRLPVQQQTNIYINRIKTEREAAEYIRQVTAQLHPEGATLVTDIAAMAERPPHPGRKGRTKTVGKTKPTRKVSAKRKKG